MVARRERAWLRAALKSRDLSAVDVIRGADANPLWGNLKVTWLLESMPGIGVVRSDRIMSALHIAPSRRIQGLGVRQRAALIAELDHP
jgi:ribosomal protein S13